ncbi:LURP-one-related/scramblase family protein [Arachnia propionica]|uniref:Scramblase n=1 Tax=Arachnia propionica TaxID=1750 RepID=A0A3P1WYD3_9ACTN|nr:LURP-one-related family protein [Arachnia propionica]RRD50697.1 hypothetical protein EII35_02900 [Arachnia propionica]
MSVVPELLSHDVVHLQQQRQLWRNDFSVLDGQGREIGRVVGTDTGAGRFFLGNRNFVLVDASQQVLAHLHDPFNWGRDTFSITLPDGQPLAHLRKEFSMFRKRISLALGDGTPLEVTGSFWDRDFEISDTAGNLMARADRKRRTLSEAFLGQDRYQINLTPGLAPGPRLAILAAIIAVDLIRDKEDNAAASSSSSN